MKYDPDKHHRRSIRLKGYDYAQNGAYYITICTQNRECLFGKIIAGAAILNDAGEIIDGIFRGLNEYHANMKIDKYILMPNHLHAIIHIIQPDVGADSISAQSISAQSISSHVKSAKNQPGLPDIVQTFKRHTTIEYIKMVKQNIVPAFNKRIWQRNYYEHVICNEDELDRIRKYIDSNPANWENDENHPTRI